MTEIEKRSDKNACWAEAILSGVVSDLIKEGLKDCTVLSKATQEDVGAFIFYLCKMLRLSSKTFKALLSTFGMPGF